MKQPLPPGTSADALVALHEQAADWHLRRAQAGWRQQDEQALQQWLAQTPLHAQVFDSMAETRQTLGLLKGLGLASAAQPEQPPQPGPQPQPQFGRPAQAWPAPWPDAAPHALPAPRRRWQPSLAMAAAACMAVALLGGGSFYWWDNTPQYSVVYQTQAQGQPIRLPDGSQIDLNVHSTLQVRYYPRRRQAVLGEGEAFFDVAADASRPFTVASGGARIRVVGTAFNVRAAPPALVVQVSAGQVEVSTAQNGGGRARKVLLKAGTGLALDPASGTYQPLQPAAASIGQWRTGQIRFDQAALGDVVAEIARYLAQPIHLQDASLARLPVSGYFSLREPEAFLQLLPATVPVRIAQPTGEGRGWVILPK